MKSYTLKMLSIAFILVLSMATNTFAQDFDYENYEQPPFNECEELAFDIDQLNGTYEQRIAMIKKLIDAGGCSYTEAVYNSLEGYKSKGYYTEQVIKLLGMIGKKAVPELIKCMDDQEMRNRQMIPKILGEYADQSDEIIAALKRALIDKHEGLNKAARYQLLRQGIDVAAARQEVLARVREENRKAYEKERNTINSDYYVDDVARETYCLVTDQPDGSVQAMINPKYCIIIRSIYPNKSFPKENQISVSYSPQAGYEQVLLKFDLAEAGINGDIKNATLKLAGKGGGGDMMTTYSIEKVISPWNPHTVTWHTRPQIDSLPLVGPTEWRAPHNFAELVNGWLSNPESNYGFLVKAEGPSKESGGVRYYDPKKTILIITYFPTTGGSSVPHAVADPYVMFEAKENANKVLENEGIPCEYGFKACDYIYFVSKESYASCYNPETKKLVNLGSIDGHLVGAGRDGCLYVHQYQNGNRLSKVNPLTRESSFLLSGISISQVVPIEDTLLYIVAHGQTKKLGNSLLLYNLTTGAKENIMPGFTGRISERDGKLCIHYVKSGKIFERLNGQDVEMGSFIGGSLIPGDNGCFYAQHTSGLHRCPSGKIPRKEIVKGERYNPRLIHVDKDGYAYIIGRRDPLKPGLRAFKLSEPTG